MPPQAQPLLSEQAAFAKHLFIQGYPLWNPDPDSLPRARQSVGLRIGDVGTVDEFGGFDVFFNVLETLPGPGGAGTPPNFPPIGDDDIRRESGDLLPREVVSAPLTLWDVEELEVMNISGFTRRTTEYRATLREDGSHVILPQGSQLFELGLHHRRLFNDHAREHGADWLHRFRDRLGWPRSDSLYLLTGFHKTCSWSIASFSMQTAANTHPVHVYCKLAEVDERTIREQSFWQPSGRFYRKIGPPPDRQGHSNQTVFIRGIVITPNLSGQGRSAHQETGLLGMLSSTSQFLTSLTGNSTKVTATETPSSNVTIQHVPNISNAAYPSEIINWYLLTKEPSAKIAVTDDSQWMEMLKLLEKGFPWTLETLENYLEELVPPHYSIVRHGDTVYLKDEEDGSRNNIGDNLSHLPGDVARDTTSSEISHAHDSFRAVPRVENLISPECDESGVTHKSSTPSISPESARSPLDPTTRAILEDCPQFRILVIGKTGVGKSSLINTVFGIDTEHASDFERGEARIADGLTSSVNPRFVLHDSPGLEPGDKDSYEVIKKFIRSKQSGPLKDRLHAVWFCVEAHRKKGPPLEAAAEDLFVSKHPSPGNTTIVGTVPMIVVFTKLDKIVGELATLPALHNVDRMAIMRSARRKAEHIISRHGSEIFQLAGRHVSSMAVSTRKSYEDTLHRLVRKTYYLVRNKDMQADALDTTSVVAITAQRINLELKVQGSISVCSQRSWKILDDSADIAGHTILDCLCVIHADMVAIWNLYDPSCYLLSAKFKELIINMVEDIEVPSVPKSSEAFPLDSSLIGAISKFLEATADPAAPILLPAVTMLTAADWTHDTYQNTRIVQQRCMTFIVDLTHVMVILFILTGSEHKRLTRRIIKIAYRIYYGSDLMARTHAEIQAYQDPDEWGTEHPPKNTDDFLQECIWSVRLPSDRGYDEIDKLDLSVLDLGRDEAW